MNFKNNFIGLITFLILLIIIPQVQSQHYTDWTGFEFEQYDSDGYSTYTVFYEITKDYTISLPDYFLEADKLPEGYTDKAETFRSWASSLPPCEWDFLSLETGGILTIKKGYRWDGPSYPCFLGMEIVDFNLRSSLVHDALYDLMRMGYLTSDEWDAGDNMGDDSGVDNAGDYNRNMADMLIYMIGVEDGQTIGDGSLYYFGQALTDYRILRRGGRSATHNNNKLLNWKYHLSGLTAYASNGQIELVWDIPNKAGKDPNYWEHFNPYKGYKILRNGVEYLTVVLDGFWPSLPVFPMSWTDSNVDNDSTYRYQIVPHDDNTNEYDWSNVETVTPVSLSGKALVLDGVNDYITADPTANDYAYALIPEPTNSSLTMEAWVYPEPAGGNGAILAFNTIDGHNLNMLFFNGDSLKFNYFDSTTSYIYSTNQFSPGQWYHVAVTKNFVGTGKLYVNGVEEASFATMVTPGHGSRFSIGQEWDSATVSNFFKGKIDEVRIWRADRNQTDIQNNMNSPLLGNEENLIALWHFDDPNDLFVSIQPPFEDSTRKAYEATKNSSDGTLFGYSAEDIPFVASGAMGQIVSVSDGSDDAETEFELLPDRFLMHQNYPNPFNPSTSIGFELPVASDVEIAIFNTLGQKIRELTNARYTAGVHQITWDGKDNNGVELSSGVYFYKISAGEFTDTKKMMLLK